MDEEIKWIVIGVLAFFGMLLGACMVDEGRQHERQMECMKLHGEWIGKTTCVFRELKAQ